MVEIAIPFNRRRVQFARRRQHLVNHGLQRGVNHSRQTPHHYVRLTQNIKRIPTRFCHDYRVTRHKSRARESFEASMRSGGCAGSGRALRLDPFAFYRARRAVASRAVLSDRLRAIAWPRVRRTKDENSPWQDGPVGRMPPDIFWPAATRARLLVMQQPREFTHRPRTRCQRLLRRR
jgi:hypothetical protein